MTEGEKTMRRLIAEQADPRTSAEWWTWRITAVNLLSLGYVAVTVFWPMYLFLGWGIIPK